MEAFLMLAGIASWFVAVFTFMVATTPIYMSAAFVMFLIGTVFVVGSALLMGINRVVDLLEARLPKPAETPGDEARLVRRITDWSAWRREHGASRSDASPSATESGAEHRAAGPVTQSRDRR